MWFLCQRRNLVARDQWTVSLDEHLAWMKRQHEAGGILLSGPAQGRTLGMYLIRAASREQADEIAAGDPFTAAGHCAYELMDWEIHQIMGAGPFSASEFASRLATR